MSNRLNVCGGGGDDDAAEEEEEEEEDEDAAAAEEEEENDVDERRVDGSCRPLGTYEASTSRNVFHSSHVSRTVTFLSNVIFFTCREEAFLLEERPGTLLTRWWTYLDGADEVLVRLADVDVLEGHVLGVETLAEVKVVGRRLAERQPPALRRHLGQRAARHLFQKLGRPARRVVGRFRHHPHLLIRTQSIRPSLHNSLPRKTTLNPRNPFNRYPKR